MIQQSKMDRIKELVELLNKAGKSYYSEGREFMKVIHGHQVCLIMNMMLYMMNWVCLKKKQVIFFQIVRP